MTKTKTVTRTAKKQQVHHPVNAQWICAVTKVAVFDFLTFSETNLAILVNLTGFSA